MLMTPLAKKGAPALLAAVRRAAEAGMTWQQFVELCAPEFGAVMREGAIDGFRPVVKERRR